MTPLLDKYRSFLPTDSNLKYSTCNMRSKLIDFYRNSVVKQLQQVQGKYNIIYSSKITIWDAISAARQLKTDLKISMSTVIDTNNGQIFHSAASILRKDIETLKKNTQLRMNCLFLLQFSQCLRIYCNSFYGYPMILQTAKSIFRK